MSQQIDAERILDAFLAPEADRLPDRVLVAALHDIARTPQRRALRVPWRFPNMPALSRATGIAAVALVALVAVIGAGGIMYLTNEPGETSGPNSPLPASLAPTTAPTVPPTARPTSDDSSSWTPYTSEVYGFTTAYPPGWRVNQVATRRWDPAVDLPIDSSLSPGVDAFVNEEGDVAFSVWRAPADVEAIANSRAAVIAWVEEFCDAAGYFQPCEGITERAIPMCRERADCHPDAVIVPFDEDVVAFFVGADDALTVAQVWRGDTDPEVAEYGGAVRLLQAYLETMNVTVPRPDQAD
jgi:hypothetical protein